MSDEMGRDPAGMEAVGNALMDAIEKDYASHPFMKGWHPADCPTEIVGDLLNALDEATRPVEAEALETGWLVEENVGGFIHWIALSIDEWPRVKITTRRARMNADFDIEETRYLTPVIRVKDANAALRFARKEDAEAFIRLFDRFLLHPVATEHQWATLRARSGMLSAEKEMGK